MVLGGEQSWYMVKGNVSSVIVSESQNNIAVGFEWLHRNASRHNLIIISPPLYGVDIKNIYKDIYIC